MSIDVNFSFAVDLQICRGQACVKGTRLAVDFILDLLANGWSHEQILENSPTLTQEGLRAVSQRCL
jgi:uncharacterized protein (DUF433 family)